MNIIRDIQHSLAVRLLKIVFSIYLVITILITMAQMLNEYFLEEMAVKNNMQVTQSIFEKSLAGLIWEFENEQLLLTTQGILKLPDIVGIKILEENGESLVNLGQTLSQNGQIGFMDKNDSLSPYLSLLSHQFTLQYEQEKNIGSVVLYSSNQVIFDKVKYNFLVIIINALIKTIILWGLFIWAFNKYLTKQLNQFCHAMEAVDIDSAKSSYLNLETFNTYELSRIKQFFNNMLRRVIDGRDKLNLLNKTLEDKVEERTIILKKTASQLEQQLKLVNDYVIISSTDTQGLIVYASRAFCHISGYSKEELYHKNLNIVRHPDMPKEIFQELWRTISSGKPWQGELKNLTKSGDSYWVSATISPIYNEAGKLVGYNSIHENISDKKRMELLSITDELTQLYNRRHFNSVFLIEIKRAARKKQSISFLICDVDHFKQYNDTYGHQKGDTALKTIGQILKTHCQRASDIAFRLGGEEFGVIFSCLDSSAALKFANKIRKAIENEKMEHRFNSASSYLTASFGLVTMQASPKLEIDDFYKQADEALYQAKDNGRNMVVVSK